VAESSKPDRSARLFSLWHQYHPQQWVLEQSALVMAAIGQFVKHCAMSAVSAAVTEIDGLALVQESVIPPFVSLCVNEQGAEAVVDWVVAIEWHRSAWCDSGSSPLVV